MDMITYVEYDEDGNIFHVAEVHTTEGHVTAPPHDAPADVQAAHKQMVAALIAERENATRDELAAYARSGKRLIVLADGETAAPDTHRVRDGHVVAK